VFDAALQELLGNIIFQKNSTFYLSFETETWSTSEYKIC